MCLHDENGTVLISRTSWVPSRLDVKEGEAMGLLDAIHWVVSLNLQQVIFELDAKSVVDNVQAPHTDRTKFGSILCECKRLLDLNPTYGVVFVRRQANVVAHSLARGATLWSGPQAFDHLPSCISDSVLMI